MHLHLELLMTKLFLSTGYIQQVGQIVDKKLKLFKCRSQLSVGKFFFSQYIMYVREVSEED